ncbi:30S ribosomal protein S20 [Microbacterium oxydans]|uniref:Small ribosomal subunit protein bS20 n=1 Tax=Microbacterium oxydans TaxID=82380 RepID=A0A0F0L5U2_9MICO|nr:30S ribosomal protein S20 [Microbacterium oxydans]
MSDRPDSAPGAIVSATEFPGFADADAALHRRFAGTDRLLVELFLGLRVGSSLTIAEQQPSSAAGISESLLYRKRPHVANIKSQIKRNKTNIKANERNKAVKSELKTLIRSTRTAVTAGDKKAAEASFKKASVKLDKAVSKGVLHKNQASNRKSALAKHVASL